MSLADELAAETAKPRSGYQCGVHKILDQLGDEAAALQAALDDKGSYSGAAIARVLSARGYAIKSQTVNRHRARGCECPRPD
jgi:hypothetical protein